MKHYVFCLFQVHKSGTVNKPVSLFVKNISLPFPDGNAN